MCQSRLLRQGHHLLYVQLLLKGAIQLGDEVDFAATTLGLASPTVTTSIGLPCSSSVCAAMAFSPALTERSDFRCEAAGLGHDRSLASVDLRGG